jgi:PAS domain S-box-containing protein
MQSIIDNHLNRVLELVDGMIMKEEEILFPMAMDTLTEEEWYKIYTETLEFGFCLIDPEDEWKPTGVKIEKQEYVEAGAIQLSSGSFNIQQLEALFMHLPIDITFVDANDKVAFFSHSPNRVFERNRSIIGRDVRMCHPPGSVNIVEQIIEDFKSGKENKAVFWMSNFQGRFIYIEYSAVRDKENNYLGVVEVTQDITQMRKLEGDQRLLSYDKK